MDTAIVVAIIGAIQAIGVAVIGALLSRSNKRTAEAEEERKKREQEQEKERIEREQAREERDACMYDLVFATASGTEVILHQAQGEKLNGNVEEALGQIRRAKSECNHVFNRQAAKL